MSNSFVTLIAPLAAILVACGGSDMSGPAPSTQDGSAPALNLSPDEINLSLNSLNESDFIEVGVLEKDENIGQGSASPWGDYIKRVRAHCDGDPAGFEPTAAIVSLADGSSDNLKGLDDLASERITLHFLDTSGSDADAVRVNIAEAARPTGDSQVDMTIVADRQAMFALHEPLLGGDFHVGIKVDTDLTEDDEFSANLTMSLGMRAYCDESALR